ncbi:hypothetical protein [uncultured Eubacterium sp.]|uniref:hypothetical protein n=1 Tax=uncultured Eubacterium sp. TaxID=165185 RepID=UPI0026721757|nr:hypothetical protein [uncultured Eubacterium sp.]
MKVKAGMEKLNLKKIAAIKNIGKEKLVLLALAGIMLIGASYFESIGQDHKNSETTVTVEKDDNGDYENTIEQKVKKIISSVEGVSNVNVMVTFKCGNEKILQLDSENSSDEGKNALKKSTVILNGNNGESPYVVKEMNPQIEGIAITAKGITNGKKEEIMNMLSALFDVPIHKISVIEN